MASRRLSLSTTKRLPSPPPRYIPLLASERELGVAGTTKDLDDLELNAPPGAGLPDDRSWSPSSSSKWPPPPTRFSHPSWRATPIELFYQYHLPRRILLVLGAALGAGAIVVLGAALDLPVIGFARTSWGLFSDERRMDMEETWRWQGVSPASTVEAEPPFLLARLGYPSYRRPIDDDPLPSILHVVPPGKDVFTYLQWLSIVSGVSRIAPRRTIAHMIKGTVPAPGENFWWDEAVRLPGFEVAEVDDFDHVFGNPVHDISHKADVIRMRALRTYGGVYIDTDVLVLRDFRELMSGKEDVVLAVEQAHGSMAEPVEVEGLCNAVIVAKKGAPFIESWWQHYRRFEGGQGFGSDRSKWNYHSVQLPWQLAKNATEAMTPITILDHRAFFSPLWDEAGLRWVHGTIRDPKAPKLKSTAATPSSSSSSSSVSAPTPAGGPKPPSARFRFALADMDSPLSSDFDEEDTPSPSDVPPDLEATLHGPLAPDVGGWSFSTTGQYAYHAWHHLLAKSIGTITDGAVKDEYGFGPDDALERDSSFNRVARRYLDPDLVERYRAWQERKRRLDKDREKKFKGMRTFRNWSGVLKERDSEGAEGTAEGVEESREPVGEEA